MGEGGKGAIAPSPVFGRYDNSISTRLCHVFQYHDDKKYPLGYPIPIRVGRLHPSHNFLSPPLSPNFQSLLRLFYVVKCTYVVVYMCSSHEKTQGASAVVIAGNASEHLS